MYTFKQAIKDVKDYLDTEYSQVILKSVDAPITKPSYRQIMHTIDAVYKMFYKSLIFNGELYDNLYRERKSLKDEMFLPDWLGKQVIKYLSLFAFCEDYRSPKLKELRKLILELINLYESYIMSDSITENEYNEMTSLHL